MRVLFILLLFLVFTSCSSDKSNTTSNAPTGESSAAKGLDISEAEKGMAEGNYIIPSPGEILTALEKMDKVNWNKLATYSNRSNYPNRYVQSLNLGVRIADGFVAVNDKSQIQCYKMNTAIEELSSSLGYGEYIKPFRDSLQGHVVAGRWNKVRLILDNLHFTVQEKIQLKGDKDIVTLAGIGGWIEGLVVVSGHLKDNYVKENTDLLNQGRLLDQYINDLNALNIQDPLVAEVAMALQKIQQIIGNNDEVTEISAAQVQQLYTTGKSVLDKIVNYK